MSAECEYASLVLTTPPATEPVTLDEAKAHLRVDYTDEDDLITSLIVAARDYCQVKTNRQFITATYTLSMCQFPYGDDTDDYAIRMPRPPLQSVTSISYIDYAGATQTLSTSVYRVDTAKEPGQITLQYNQYWPGVRYLTNAVNVVFKAGYGDDATDVPEGIKVAMKMLIGHWFANREAVAPGSFGEVPIAVDAILMTLAVPEVY